MVSEGIVDASRLQFALTAMYHFLFVPLTLGLTMMMAIAETIYVKTGNEVWKDITKFWAKLFAINFAMGVATGIPMEFQFGTNWSYFSHYVGDIFGAPLAMEVMTAFFLESTFIGIFFFGWNKFSKKGHLVSTWMIAIGSALSALWILAANAWMQHPVGSHFNPNTMRMELSSFMELMGSSTSAIKLMHTVSAGYVCGAMFMIAISSYYLIRGKFKEVANKSMVIASSFGLVAILMVIFAGDEAGHEYAEQQPMKIAAIEGHWDTGVTPAAFSVFALPSMETKSNSMELKIPAIMGLLVTRSLDTPVIGINQLVEKAKGRIRNGIKQYTVLERYRKGKSVDADADEEFLKNNYSDLGYAFLLKREGVDITKATEADIDIAADSTIPNVPVLYWSFRVMVLLGFAMLFILALNLYYSNFKNKTPSWLLWISFLALPLPWISIELGWIVAEYGRQPWVIYDMLPTSLGASALSVTQSMVSLVGYMVFYSVFLVVDLYFMVKYIKQGPRQS